MSQMIFKNYGGSYQLRIQDVQDLEKVRDLDETHWAATSVPIESLNCDRVLASYVDTDKNGRIRTDEVKAALVWLFRFLANRSRLSESTDVLRLSDIDTSHPEGEKLRSVAKFILSNLNAPDAKEISLVQVRDIQSIMSNAANNGDGIISPEGISDSDIAQFITAVMQTVGSVSDASGKPGVSQEQLNAFVNEAESYLAWKAEGEISEGKNTPEVMPWGSDTPQAYELIVGLEEKIEQYFAQCAMVGFDERAAAEMRLHQKELEEIDFTDKSMMEDRVRNAPLAVPSPEGSLDLDAKINPFYAECLFNLKEKVLKRILGKPVKKLTQEQWGNVKNIFAAYRVWLKNKKGAKVENLGEDKLRAYLDGPYKARVSELIAEDLAVADDLNQTHNLEKLILYQKWLMELVNNFVCFSNLYDPQSRALFEMGTLVIDGRQITFTMKVQDRQAHKKIAEKSFMYLLYMEVTGRREEDIKFDIVAVVTSGTAGRLRIGKRGIFFSIDGKEWDAQIVDIVENPISPWESVKAPFQQINGFIKKQIDKFTKSRQTKMEASIAAPSASGMTRDLLLGGGIAIAALGSSLAYITKALSQVTPIQISVTLAGLATFILLPGMIMGFLKIRKRDMSVLLEALGWAVNVHMRLNNSLGKLFTHTPHLPKDARKERKDVVEQFLKDFGETPLRSRPLYKGILIIVLMVLVLMLAMIIYPGIMNNILFK